MAWLGAAALAGAVWLLLPDRTTHRLRRGPGVAGSPLDRARRRWRELRARPGAGRRRAAAVLELTEALAAELRGGRLPPAALAAALAATPVDVVPAEAAAAALAGGPVAELLDRAAAAPGAAGLRGVAACWRVSEQSGAGLARGLERVAQGLRDQQRVADEVSAQLSGPRSTGRLLALLPVFGWVLGAGLGAAPVQVLVGTAVGWVCLAVGLPLQLVGWWWMERMAAAVEPGRT